MREYVISITDDGDVFLNGTQCYCILPMDKENDKIDADKRALLALADKMGYETTYLFYEMGDRLEEILDEIDREEL